MAAAMLRAQRPHFASQPRLRNSPPTLGRPPEESADWISRSESTLQEQSIIGVPSLETLQTAFPFSSLCRSPEKCKGFWLLFLHGAVRPEPGAIAMPRACEAYRVVTTHLCRRED